MDLEHLAGGADRIAVVDCETTGVYDSDRVVEVAIVTIDLAGATVETWETLVQPQRDVGASHIHGLTADSLRDAPTFGDIAGDVAIRLDGACIAAHNLPFDARMVTNEFSRIDADLTLLSGIDTLRATGLRLGAACEAHGISLTSAHSAAADAGATARLLLQVADRCEPGTPAAAPTMLLRSSRVLRRADASWYAPPDPPYLAALAATLDLAGLETSTIAYLELVERALADLHLDREERTQLATLASDVGLNAAQQAQAHRRFVNDLIDAALADGVVTDDELDALVRVAAALDVDSQQVARRTRGTTSTESTVSIAPGLTVVFTGDDPSHPRDDLVAHARRLGLTVATGVTKVTDLVVAYDTVSSSGKANKARSYGIPIASTASFAAARDGEVLEATTAGAEALKVITCPDCHATWTVSARSPGQRIKRCADCAAVTRAASPKPSSLPPPPTTETLTCARCGRSWTRTPTRGRKPHNCPDCSPA